MASLPCQTQGGGVCGGLCGKFFQKPSSHLEKRDKALLKLQPRTQRLPLLTAETEAAQQPPRDFLPLFGYHIPSLPTPKISQAAVWICLQTVG